MIILKLRSALNLDYFLLLKKINKNRNNQIRVLDNYFMPSC